MLELLLAEGPLHPQSAAPHRGRTGLQQETECSRGTAQRCTGPQLERQGERTKTYHSWPLICDASAQKAGEMVAASWVAVAEWRVVMCDQQEMWFVSAACSPPADHGCSTGVSLSEEPAESLSKNPFWDEAVIVRLGKG